MQLAMIFGDIHEHDRKVACHVMNPFSEGLKLVEAFAFLLQGVPRRHADRGTIGFDRRMSGISLSDDAFEAILDLAASAPSSSGVAGRPSLPAGTEVRVAIWDETRGIKLSGEAAPTAEQLPSFLAAHPHCHVYVGEPSAFSPNPSVSYRSGSKETILSRKRPMNALPPSLGTKRARSGAENVGMEPPPAQRAKRIGTPPPLPTGFIRQTEAAQHAAWSAGGPINVLLAMEAHPADPQLQADGCQALTFLASHTPDYKRRVCAAGGAIAIVRALETHGAVPKHSPRSPAALLDSELARAYTRAPAPVRAIRLPGAHMGNVPSPPQSLLMQVPAVALQGCGALAVLTMEEQARASVREAGGAGALLRAMRLHPGEARLQQLGCTALASLAEMHVLPAEPLATAAVAAMRAFPTEAALQAQGCRTLLHLTTTAPRKRAVCALGGADAVVLAMLGHGMNAQVQQWGCGALSSLADGDESCHRAVCEAARDAGVARLPSGRPASGGVHAIVYAMAMQPTHVQVAQLGCAALAALLAGAGGAAQAQCAAAALEVVECGGAALTVRAMERHRTQWLVQLQGCAMLALLAGLEGGAAAAAAAGGAPAALEALRAHPGLPEVVRWAMRVLRSLPRPHLSASAAAAAAVRARTMRLSRSMLGSWRLGDDGRDGKLPLDLLNRIASLACAAESGAPQRLLS